MKATLQVWVCLLVGLLAGCGSQNPAAPVPPSLSLSIAPQVDLLIVGDSVPLRAMAQLADGVVREVTPVWSSDQATVAALGPSGTLTGLRSGRVRITAAASGVNATMTLRVIPRYSGTWRGSAVIVGCHQYNFRTCGRSFPPGTTATASLGLVQDGLQINGLLDLSFPLIPGWDFHPGWVSSVDGTILGNDQILLKGKFGDRDPSNGSIHVFEEPSLFLKEWTSSLSGQTLSGAFEMSNFYPYPEDYNYVRWRLGPLTSDFQMKDF